MNYLSYLCTQIASIMQTIQVKDKSFSLFISEKEILKEVKRIARQINKDYAGKEPVFLAVLNGSFIFLPPI